MKLAVCFILGFLVLVTKQQRFPYQHQSPASSPWAFQEYQFNNDLYSYLLARRLAQSPYSAFSQLDSYAGNTRNAFNGPQPAVDPIQQEKLFDIERKTNSFGGDPFDQVNPRFLLNYATTAGSNNYNPLLKTVYLFTSSIITTTAVTTCIPATHFVAASSTIVCRRRREVLEVLKQINDAGDSQESEIAPSTVEHMKVQPTADPISGVQHQAALLSSLDEKNIEGSYDPMADSLRNKRFFGGLFYSTTTLTSYVLSTVSSTRTLSTLVTTSALSCRPSNYIVC